VRSPGARPADGPEFHGSPADAHGRSESAQPLPAAASTRAAAIADLYRIAAALAAAGDLAAAGELHAVVGRLLGTDKQEGALDRASIERWRAVSGRR